MDVLNDRPKEEDSQPPLDPFRAVTLAFFSAAGISTFVFAPLPTLLAEARLPEPWPKLACLGGAFIAVALLEAPIPWVAVAFALSLVFADSIHRMKVWKALALGAVAALFTAGVSLIVTASQAGQSPWVFWQAWIAAVFKELQTAVPNAPPDFQWAALQHLFTYEAPFLLVATSILAAWISLGLSVHFKLLESKKLTAAALRKQVRIPAWFAIGAGLAFVVVAWVPVPFYVMGLVRIAGAVLFIQGSVCLSAALERWALKRGARTLVFALFIIPGFYALVALGVVSPLYFRARALIERKA